MRFLRRRPSPGLVVAVVALSVALVGTAIAGQVNLNNGKIKPKSIGGGKLKKDTVTGAKIKESTLAQVPSAKKADTASTATTATTAGSAQPVAFVELDGAGTVNPANSKGVTQTNITHPNNGVDCISGIGFPIRGGQVTPIFGGSNGTTANFTVGATGFCPNGGQVLTFDNTNTLANIGVNVLLYG